MHTRIIGALLLIALIAHTQGQDSLCDKFAAALKLNDWQVVGAVVNGTVTSVVGNAVTKPYFDGSLNPYQTTGLTNYTDPGNSAQTNALVHSLHTFFYSALNCTDGTGEKYSGKNMKEVHAHMPIGPEQFESFNRQLLAVLAANGVSVDDQFVVYGVLNSLKADICNQPACFPQNASASICDRYSAKLNVTSYQLMDKVVTGVLANITAPTPVSPLLRFFNGTSNSINYLTNPGALNALKNHLDQFFGGALGCTGYFLQWKGNLTDSHKSLPIDQVAFDMFNQVIIGVLASVNVAQADLTAVLGVLESTKSSICTLCGTQTTTGGAASTTGGAATTGSAASTTGSTTGIKPISTTTTGQPSTSSAAVVIPSAIFMAFVAITLFL